MKAKKEEKKTESIYNVETESESEIVNYFEDEGEMVKKCFKIIRQKDRSTSYCKVIHFKLIPFIFTEKYKQINGFIKDSNISCYSLLNIINSGIISEIEYKLIEKSN